MYDIQLPSTGFDFPSLVLTFFSLYSFVHAFLRLDFIWSCCLFRLHYPRNSKYEV